MSLSKPVPTLTKALVSVALCFATTPAYATAACQGQGCVLPVTDAPPPPVVTDPGPAFVEEGGGIGLLPILLGLAAVALAAYLLIDDDDEEEEELPISPG